jgi:DNA-binding PadR family transcriptional regulator
MHGYAPIKEVERMSEYFWRRSSGSANLALKELQRSGFIIQGLEERKWVYHLT